MRKTLLSIWDKCLGIRGRSAGRSSGASPGKEGAAHTNPQKGLCSWFQRVANQRDDAPAHSFENRLHREAIRKLCKRDHFWGEG